MTETGASGGVRLELVTRADCHLCEEMAELLNAELPQYGLNFTSINIDADADLQRRFGEVVPVLLRDGSPVAKVRLNAGQLRRIVRRRR